jgi:dolichyl-diphosphooligosaccharide--protein glycosyltransferase
MMTQYGQPGGFDRVRNYEIGKKNFELEVIEEAFSSEHFIVRIYKVKDLDNRN